MASDPRFRVVLCPRGTAAVVSDREPGPTIGAPGSLSGWREAPELGPPGLTFDAACKRAHAHNAARAGLDPAALPRVRGREVTL